MFKDLDGEIVFLDAEAGRYFSLDGVGRDFWKLVQDGESFENCVATLLRQYNVDEAVLRADLERLLSSLMDRGLLVA